MRGGSTRPMGAKRNAPDPCPSARDRKEAALGPTTRRWAGKNRARLRFNSACRASLQNDNAATRQNTERRCPTTPPSQIKTQTYGFFRAGRPLRRLRRRANNPGSPQTHIDPARAPLLAAPERGRLTIQETRFRNLQRATQCHGRRQARSLTGVQSPGPTPQTGATARRPPGRRRSRWSIAIPIELPARMPG